MQLAPDGGKLAGTVSRGKPTPITGTVDGDRVRFEWKDQWGTLNQLEGRAEKGELSGTASFSGESPGLMPPMPWRARRRRDGQARRSAHAGLRTEGVPPRLLEHD